jgi:hypothetical protein
MESKKINQLATNVSPQTSDLTIIGDPITGVSKKITLLQIADLFATTGTVTSVAVTETGDALTITGSPITSAGTINIGFAGDATQYVRGDGALADFPTSTGGGSSVSYYLNSSVSQGTIGGVAYRELSKDPISGAGTDITISANGYVASYITDANDPSLLEVPGGNFNCEFYFSVNSNAHNPFVYAELYKYDGTTFTLLGSSTSVPEYLTNGTTLSPYYFAIPVATAALTVTDRLAIRIFVNVDTKTVTLHTENNHLCQVVTTFSKGLTSLNNLTRQVQFLATGTSGTDFAISSSTATHTFNLPIASAANTGKLSSTDWSTFNGKQAALSFTAPLINTSNTISIDLSNYVTLNGIQTITGEKTFANNTLKLAATGSGGLVTFLSNISGTGLTSSGSNALGFNINNDIYFAGSDKVGGVFSFNNTAVRTYTLQNANGTLAFTSDIPSLTGYVPYTGATANVDLGAFNLTSTNLISKQLTINTTSNYGGSVILESGSLGITGSATNGITLAANSNTVFRITSVIGGSQFRFAQFNLASLGNGQTRTYTLPDADGTVALTSNLSAYLPLTGGTLTGALNGTSAVFSSTVQASAYRLTGMTAGSGALYWSSDRVTLANYNASGTVTIETGGGTTALTLAANQAATFSSSVTTNSNLVVNKLSDSDYIALKIENRPITNSNTSAGYIGFYSNPGNGSNNTLSTGRIYGKFDANSYAQARLTFSTVTGDDVYQDVMTLKGTNVGIGTSSPTKLLSIGTSAGAPTNGFNILYGTDEVASFTSNSATGEVKIGATNAIGTFFTTFYSNNTERMRITSGGNVGIGTSSPSEKLVVSGKAIFQVTNDAVNDILTLYNVSATSAGVRQRFQNGFGDLAAIRVSQRDNGALADDGLMEFQVASNSSLATKLSIRNDGLVAFPQINDFTTGNSPNTWINPSSSYGIYINTSSIRYKKDIVNYDKGLDIVNQLRPVYYKGISEVDGDKQFAGFIAEEIHDLGLTEFVNYLDDGRPNSLSYPNMITLLTKAIQELKAEIDKLKNK